MRLIRLAIVMAGLGFSGCSTGISVEYFSRHLAAEAALWRQAKPRVLESVESDPALSAEEAETWRLLLEGADARIDAAAKVIEAAR